MGPPVAADSPIDRRSMPAEPIGDHTDRCSGCMQPEQRVTLLERRADRGVSPSRSHPIRMVSRFKCKSTVVRLPQRKGPKGETKNGPKWGYRGVLVVRTICQEWPHSAGFRPLIRSGKRMSRLARLAEERNCRRTLSSAFSMTYEPHKNCGGCCLENPGPVARPSPPAMAVGSFNFSCRPGKP